jgi:hypothetical protein
MWWRGNDVASGGLDERVHRGSICPQKPSVRRELICVARTPEPSFEQQWEALLKRIRKRWNAALQRGVSVHARGTEELRARLTAYPPLCTRQRAGARAPRSSAGVDRCVLPHEHTLPLGGGNKCVLGEHGTRHQNRMRV